MRIAVTGGAGYIGSHTVVTLLASGHDVLILDNFVNAEFDVPDRVAEIAGCHPEVAECDITDEHKVATVLGQFVPDALIHFAGLKAVGEAVENPLEYYRVNLGGSITILREMAKIGCNRLVFSSSATVYGTPEELPIPEDHTLRPTNPYGHTKRFVEQIIEDWGVSNKALSAVSLRYFNPVGAHSSAKLGEAPLGRPNNLMPLVAQVAAGWRDKLLVYGNDYETPDGTGVRDYIHVMDLAAAHLAALELTGIGQSVQAINVGTGRGYSVLEIIRAFEAISNREVPFDVAEKRRGDVAISVADPRKAKAIMGWESERGLHEMCRDAWAWQCARNH